MLTTNFPDISETQAGFLEKHVKSSVLKRHKEVRAELAVRYAGFEAIYARVVELADQVAFVASSEKDSQFINETKAQLATVVSSLTASKDGARKTLVKVKQAEVNLRAIEGRVKGYVKTLADDAGHGVDDQVAIKLRKVQSNAVLLEKGAQFDEKVAKATETIVGDLGGTVLELPPKQLFKEAMTLYGGQIRGVATRDPALTLADAKAILTEVDKGIQDAFTKNVKALDAYVAGDNFAHFVADAKLRAKIEATIKAAREFLTKLERWEIEGAADIRTRIKAIEAELDTVFTSQSGISVDQRNAKEAEQKALEEKASALEFDAGSKVINASLDFSNEQEKLAKKIASLEADFAKVSGSLKSDQKASISGFFVQLHFALEGLNGSNVAGLKVAENMMYEAADLVAQAANIGPINDEIKANIVAAKKAAKDHSNPKKNPLHAAFAEHLKEIEIFEKEWTTKVPAAARTRAAELLKALNDRVTDNQSIITSRVQVDKEIALREAEFAKLNVIFRKMLAKNGKPESDYNGALIAELQTCRNWNVEKLDPVFFSTILNKLTGLKTKIAKMNDDIGAAMKMTEDEMNLMGLNAQSKLENTLRELQNEAVNGLADPAKIAEAKAEYTATMDTAALQSELLAEVGKEAFDKEKALEAREKYLADAPAYVAKIKMGQKKVGDQHPLNYYGDEVSRQLERIETTVKNVKKDKAGDIAARSLSELGHIQHAIERIVLRGEPTNKNELGKITTEWDAEIRAFKKKSDELLDNVKAYVSDNDDKEVVEKLKGVLDEIQGRLNDNRFEGPAGILGADPAKDAATRKRAREAALNEVRRLKKLIMDDAVVRKCVLNPFGVAAFATTAQNRLEEIELNVLRGA